jgi:transcriptional regulator with XRE-family HTH domain
MDFKSEREKRGLTLAQVSEQTGYKVATINGLELHGKGSYRLKIALNRFYGNEKPIPYSELQSPHGIAVREGEDLHHEIQLWKARAKQAEKELHEMRSGIRALLETPQRAGAKRPSSKTASELVEHERLLDAAEDKGQHS